MTDDMIERVARSITEVLRAKGASSRMMDAGKDAARAAIKAMREPTEAMLSEGCIVPIFIELNKEAWTVPSKPETVDIWQNMIDAALK